MKYLFTISLLVASLGSTLAASAASGAPAATASAPRPLVRYLAAALHLPPSQAQRVQRAVLRAPLALRTPEQVAERLRPVLSATQFERYSQLQGDVVAYEHLHRLAAQH